MADLTIAAADVAFSPRATIVRGTASVALNVGQAVYYTGTKWALAGAAVADIATVTVPENFGIVASASAADGQPVNVCIADPDFTPSDTLAVGTVGVVSATAGNIAAEGDLAANNAVIYLIFPTSTTKAILRPIPVGAAHA